MSTWTILYLGACLDCDSPILEAIWFSIYRPCSRDVWSRLSDKCTLDTLFQEFFELMKTIPYWSCDHVHNQSLCWLGGPMESYNKNRDFDYCSIIRHNNSKLTIIERRAKIGQELMDFLLDLKRSKSNLSVFFPLSGRRIDMMTEYSPSLSIKEQILKANSLLSECISNHLKENK